MYKSLNKQLTNFQNCSGVLFRLCQRKGYNSLLLEHDTIADNLLFASCGLSGPSLDGRMVACGDQK